MGECEFSICVVASCGVMKVTSYKGRRGRRHRNCHRLFPVVLSTWVSPCVMSRHGSGALISIFIKTNLASAAEGPSFLDGLGYCFWYCLHLCKHTAALAFTNVNLHVPCLLGHDLIAPHYSCWSCATSLDELCPK